MTEIYLIVAGTWRDRYNGGDYWDSSVDPDYGFFTDKEAAEAKAFDLNRPIRDSYAKYVAEIEQENKIREHNHRIAAKEREVLVAAGLKQKQLKKAAQTTPRDFDSWERYCAFYVSYSVETVQEAPHV